MLYPDVQRKAQAELDSVLGEKDSLLSMTKKTCRISMLCARSLYVSIPSLLSVCVSVRSISPDYSFPTGIPHGTLEDDVFEGHFHSERIGRFLQTYGKCHTSNISSLHSTYFANRAMTHDPEVYKDPMSFNPERFPWSQS